MTSLQNTLVLLHYVNLLFAFFQSYVLQFSSYLMSKIYWFWDVVRCVLPCCYQKFEYLLKWSHRAILFYLNSFWIQLLYFMIISLLGFFVLVVLDRKITRIDRPTASLDLFYMSVSATTVSSLVSMNMEDFSVSQLVVLTVLMLFGGEVFTSMISLNLKKIRLTALVAQNEPKICTATDIESAIKLSSGGIISSSDGATTGRNNGTEPVALTTDQQKKLKCLNYLRHLLLGYFTVVQLCGIALILLYFCLNAEARKILERKRISPVLFSVFTTVSSFASCGLIPTNENMMAFKEHSVLLVILIPLVMMGSTMFPPCVNLVMWVIKRAFPRAELNYLLENAREMRFAYLFPLKNSLFLAVSDLGFIMLQFILFCFLEWNSEATAGLSAYQKVIGGIFQSVNSRHSGESAFDISLFSPALLVVYIIMMYIPPYTFLSPNKKNKKEKGAGREAMNGGKEKGKGGKTFKFWLPPQPAYPVLFIVIVCLTEQSSIRRDPLNFSILNIAFEVMSAYGNVGLSIGYSCHRLLKIVKSDCKDTSASFSGKWSKQGKIVIITVMFFGRLKKFTAGGGKAWHTL